MPWSDGLDPASPAHRIASSQNPEIRVVAGPGTGKSFAMKRRVAKLLEDGIEPRAILPVTFTRVAAEDLHRELVGMDVPGCEEIEGVTLHSLAFRMLSRNHVLQATGRTPRPLNDFEIKPLIADLKDAHNGVMEVKRRIKAYEAAWARLQREEPGYVQSPEDRDFENDLLPWLLFHRAMLIGEVIPHLYNYLRSNPAAQERGEFSHILVDEYQDLNKAEQRVIDLLANNAEVCVVGDDDQSIYSFKHAHPDGIRDWIDARPEADDLALDECRRCPTRVVDMASHLIAQNVNRPVPREIAPRAENGPGAVRIMQYPTLAGEVGGVVNTITDMVANGVPPGDILVLAQRGVIGTPIYEGLVVREVPVKSYYAESELDSEDAQHQFALLKLFVDREDRVALRWLLGLGSGNWLSGGYRRLRDYCEENNLAPWQTLEQLDAEVISIPYTGLLVSRFRAILDEIQALEGLEGLTAVVNRLFPDGDDRVRDLRDLALHVLEEVGDENRDEFFSELSDAITKPEIPSEIEDVRIMSLHKSKGLSAPVTFVCGCVQGLLPRQPSPNLTPTERQASIEEHRRLFYVGITRVKAVPDQGKTRNVGSHLLTNYARRRCSWLGHRPGSGCLWIRSFDCQPIYRGTWSECTGAGCRLAGGFENVFRAV